MEQTLRHKRILYVVVFYWRESRQKPVYDRVLGTPCFPDLVNGGGRFHAQFSQKMTYF